MRRSLTALTFAATMLLVAATPALAHDAGEGLYGETTDKVVTNFGFALIAFFPLFVLTMSLIQLALDKRNKKIAGVCSGFARYLEVDVTLVRIVVLVFALLTGIGFIAYLIAWLLMPNGAEVQPAPPEGALQQT